MDKCCFAIFGKTEEEVDLVSNIINFNIPHLSERIFGFLSDLDLVQCWSVCQTWRIICGDLIYQRWKRSLLEPFRSGRNEIVKVLLDHPKSQEIKTMTDEFGFTPLIIACQFFQIEVVQMLLDIPDIDVDAVDKSGKSALIWACRHDNWEVVKLLLKDNRIDPNRKDKFGETLFMMACQYDRHRVVHGLLKHYHQETTPTSPQINFDETDDYGQTGLMKACVANSTKTVQTILREHPWGSMVVPSQNIKFPYYINILLARHHAKKWYWSYDPPAANRFLIQTQSGPHLPMPIWRNPFWMGPT